MPWTEIKPMDARVLFVADHLRRLHAFSELCAGYGVSRKTGYKWIERYDREGIAGLEEKSRRPHFQPAQLPYAVRQAILELRHQGRIELGPKKIQALLASRYPDQPVPCRTTIYRVLKQAGQIMPRRLRRRVAPMANPLQPARTANTLWSADFKGQFLMRNAQWCYPLTVMDHASRYLLDCRALAGTRGRPTQTVFQTLFRRYGLPQRVPTDNGVPFASIGPGGLSRLSIWWIRLGIVPERIAPGQPQQNGRHERMHRTLKRAVTHPPASGVRAQQHCFDDFCHQYNTQRPHEALQQRTPASAYTASSRPYPERLPELVYPSYQRTYQVSTNGVIYYNRHTVYVGYLLAGEHVGLEPVGDGVNQVHFGRYRWAASMSAFSSQVAPASA